MLPNSLNHELALRLKIDASDELLGFFRNLTVEQPTELITVPALRG
jgi:hypothetical protein